MTWLDIAVAAIIITGVLAGWGLGLSHAVGLAIGVLATAILAGMLAEAAANTQASTPGVASVTAAVVYSATGASGLTLLQALALPLGRFLDRVRLPAGDGAAGAMAGGIIGLMVAAAVVMVLARLAFAAAAAPEGARADSYSREELQQVLADSYFTPTLLNIFDRLPGQGFLLVPEGFHAAIGRLATVSRE